MNTLKQELQILTEQSASQEEIFSKLIAKGYSVSEIQNELALQVPSEKQQKSASSASLVTAVVSIGVALIGLGIFSFLAANWEYMPDFLRVGILITTMLSSYIGGWQLVEKTQYSRIGHGLIFLGTMVYGASIFLIAQMFHIRANWPDGFILWMIGSVIVGFTVRSYTYYLLAFILGLIVAISHFFVLFELSDLASIQILTSFILLLVGGVMSAVIGTELKKEHTALIDSAFETGEEV